MKLIIYIGLLFIFLLGCKQSSSPNSLSAFETLEGVGDFAPELWVEKNTYKGSFSDDYKRFHFFRKLAPDSEKYLPYISEFSDSIWETPVIPDYYEKSHSYTYQLNVPGKDKLVFIANKSVAADTSSTPNYNFWEIDISDNAFGSPQELGYKNVIYNYNSQPCITNSGNIYFTSDLPDWSQTFSYVMSSTDQGFAEPVIFEPVNSWRELKKWRVYEFCMAPDEDYMIVCIQEVSTEARLNTDLYISFPKAEGWTMPKKLSKAINTQATENFPTITADGKYLIFTRDFSAFKIIRTAELLKGT